MKPQTMCAYSVPVRLLAPGTDWTGPSDSAAPGRAGQPVRSRCPYLSPPARLLHHMVQMRVRCCEFADAHYTSLCIVHSPRAPFDRGLRDLHTVAVPQLQHITCPGAARARPPLSKPRDCVNLVPQFGLGGSAFCAFLFAGGMAHCP